MNKAALMGIAGLFVLSLHSAQAQQRNSEANHPGIQQAEAAGSALAPEFVRTIQEALNNKGYHIGTADGKWGSTTQNALKAFQKAEGLKATGQIDRQTLAKLGISVEGAAANRVEPGQWPGRSSSGIQ